MIIAGMSQLYYAYWLFIDQRYTILGKGENESSLLVNFQQLPTCLIPGSQKASISITGTVSLKHNIISEGLPISLPCLGDIASPPNLSHLLVLPYGCGEQNLVKLALNTAVAKYLQQTGGLTKHTVNKVQFNLQTGIAS